MDSPQDSTLMMNNKWTSNSRPMDHLRNELITSSYVDHNAIINITMVVNDSTRMRSIHSECEYFNTN